MTIDEIKNKLSEIETKRYLNNNAIVHISIAGSYARKNNNETSDIDLIVEVDESTLTTNYFTLPRYLESRLWKHIDLIDKDYINPHIKNSLLSHTVSVW